MRADMLHVSLRLREAFLLGRGPIRSDDAIQGPADAIGVRLVHVRIEDLDLVAALQIDTAVGPSLACLLGHERQPEFDMELEIRSEFLFGHDVALRWDYFHVA